ncbi:MAG: hypothetical protein E7B97_16535 [Enterobacter sp.]|uniref:hypothetical protein n=1 Tax=Enterobacter sp. TaxID=42895 RepID=UPI0029000813|nr:hypothetical protein [Enterobacter sp.]MDU2767867.1 hypothetical protein [Enterobacter sp.]MDU2782157.1 hypothetical protein [Enterobacter sp.]MDU2842354.1 hypothetical protein [Enterobacter sp.]
MLINIAKAFSLSFLLLTSFSSFSRQIPQPILDALSGLRIEKIKLDNQILTVIYQDEDVGDLMALTAAESVCSSRFSEDSKWPDDTLKSIRVLNHWQMQGYTFDIDAKSCDEYGYAEGTNANEFFKERMKKYP